MSLSLLAAPDSVKFNLVNSNIQSLTYWLVKYNIQLN